MIEQCVFSVFPQIIEKRRRDRINNSLSELRRLVPSAFEKQVSSRQHSFNISPAQSIKSKSMEQLRSFMFFWIIHI